MFGRTYTGLATAQESFYGSLPPTTEDKIVALTFDDGPNGLYTSQLLDILSRHEVHVTFFVVGINVNKYPDIVRRMVTEGHAVGNHTCTNPPGIEITGWSYKELDAGQRAIYNAIGRNPVLFRPPFGKKTPWMLTQVRRHGMTTITWSVSVNDAHAASAQVVADRIMQRTHPGSIIVLHDGDEMRYERDRTVLLDAVPQIVERLKAEGYTFVTVPQMLNLSAYLLDSPASVG